MIESQSALGHPYLIRPAYRAIFQQLYSLSLQPIVFGLIDEVNQRVSC